MARLLITRPAAQAAASAAVFEARGHEVLSIPLTAIRPVAAAWPGPDAGDALAVTSANAVPQIPESWAEAPIFAVGDKTATVLRERGLRVQGIGPGDGSGLARVLARHLPEGARVLHATGEHPAAGLRDGLEAAGLVYTPLTVYKAEPCERLPGRLRAALDEGRLDAVLLYSPRSAALLVQLAAAADLLPALARLRALCLSGNVARAVGEVPWRAVAIAAKPEEAALGRLLEDPKGW